MKVLAFGEILWDVIEGTEWLGGAPFNFAAHTAKCGNESYIISRLGSDFLGMRAYNLSRAHNVDVSFIQWDEVHPTGIVDVSLVDGQPDYVIRQNVAYDFIDSTTASTLSSQKFDIFYFGSLAQRCKVSSRALYAILERNSFKHIFYDVNLRKDGYSEEIIKKSLAACTMFKLNIDELSVISKFLVGESLTQEAFCECVKTLYPNVRTIIITASERGCFVFEDQLLYVPGTPVTVRDAVGAGDAFSAAFMHVYGLTGDAFLSARVANQVGAFVATRTGAIPDYSLEVQSLLRINTNNLSDAAHNIL